MGSLAVPLNLSSVVPPYVPDEPVSHGAASFLREASMMMADGGGSGGSGGGVRFLG